jgi:hypothetical protein
MPNPELYPRTHVTPSIKDLPQGSIAHRLPVPNNRIGSPHAPNTGPSAQRESSLPKGRCYDRPGKKPAADLETDPIKLHDKLCQERGGNNYATDWALTVFMYGVDKDVLLRVLTPQEITVMNSTGSFEPRQVYDGFITKVGDHYECGLCKEDKETYWKSKKNAPRHLRKFHFGLADMCEVWCVPPIPILPQITLLIICTTLIAGRMCTATAK